MGCAHSLFDDLGKILVSVVVDWKDRPSQQCRTCPFLSCDLVESAERPPPPSAIGSRPSTLPPLTWPCAVPINAGDEVSLLFKVAFLISNPPAAEDSISPPIASPKEAGSLVRVQCHPRLRGGVRSLGISLAVCRPSVPFRRTLPRVVRSLSQSRLIPSYNPHLHMPTIKFQTPTRCSTER